MFACRQPKCCWNGNNLDTFLDHLKVKMCLLGAGNYTCELEWSGRPVSVTHSLTVLQPPSISHPPAGSHLQRDQGGELSLSCRADGDPRPQVRVEHCSGPSWC